MLKINLSVLPKFVTLLVAILVSFVANVSSARGQDTYAAMSQTPANSTFVNGKLLDFIPNQTQMGLRPPMGSVVLLSTETNRFLSKDGGPSNWRIENGVITSTGNASDAKSNTNHVVSEVHFRDADIHVEFKLPAKGKGNSGIYIHGNYELQILKSFEKGSTQELSHHDVGALYGFAKPLSNASKPAQQWQVYDIRYRAPRRSPDGSINTNGEITAWLNGILVQHATTFAEPRSVYHPYRYGTTDYLKTIWQRQKETSVGPVFLQDHGDPVKFRNIWIKPLDDKSQPYKPENPPSES